MLFKGTHLGGKIVRQITHSTVDHVGMIIKLKSDEDENTNNLYVLEAVGDGVNLNKWEDVRDYLGKSYSHYSECVYRHLVFPRTEDQLENLDYFLKEVVGHKYSLNPKKILQNKTTYL